MNVETSFKKGALVNLLLIGGAGYIGSHTAHLLKGLNHKLTVLDSFYSGHLSALPENTYVLEGDFGDEGLLTKIFSEQTFDGILHFAAYIEVEESTRLPIKYFENNTAKTILLLKKVIEFKIPNFVFSSTAASYGEPLVDLIEESTPQLPINPYGKSKQMSEEIIKDCAGSQEAFRYSILRYFNVAGAHPMALIGQDYPRPSHLITLAAQAALGAREKVQIYGDNYPTADGTCIRDYIHVEDLARAHVDAIEYLDGGGSSDTFNCGYGQGYSVKEVIKAMKRVSGVDFPVEITSRRTGDPTRLVAKSDRIKQKLGWRPHYDNLETICKHAFAWEKKKLSAESP